MMEWLQIQPGLIHNYGSLVFFQAGRRYNTLKSPRPAPPQNGLAAITEVPAQIYGGAAERGTLERGKIADVVVWSGDPLELTSRAEVVIIGGAVQSLVTHQSRLLDRYKTLPKQ